MHVNKVVIHPEKFPTKEHYPFNLELFNRTEYIEFDSPVTFFTGENGTGKSTLLKAMAQKCNIHMWEAIERMQYRYNVYEKELYRCIDMEWNDGMVPGSFFSADVFRNFAEALDEWAKNDPELLNYYGGESLVTKSHGQCNMAYFENRYKIKGLYLLDEPESALSPRKMIELMNIISRNGKAGHAQFIIATHSPILLAVPGAVIYSFDEAPVKRVMYEDTEYYRIYKSFMEDRESFIHG